jgi:sugar phosphate isomerase/epimerase
MTLASPLPRIAPHPIKALDPRPGAVPFSRDKMKRRACLTALPALATVRSLLAAAEEARARVGICGFSCHQHWKAVGAGHTGVKFRDTPGFYRYGRSLGAEGVQASLRGMDAAAARALRGAVEAEGGYYEADVSLPRAESDLPTFDAALALAREAGATVARAVFTGGRRYEVFKTREEFLQFQAAAERSLALAEPLLRRHRVVLAVENHKDFTTGELLAVLGRFDSEWIGVLVDTGNNIALLEEPHAVIEALALYARSVHLKDMAVQPDAGGFLLSEVPLGTGMLDLPRIVSTLGGANPGIVFNLEMATRDPLTIPCLSDAYWETFGPEDRENRLAAALDRVKAHPLRQEPPRVSGKPVDTVLAEEEAHNRHGLAWMRERLGG